MAASDPPRTTYAISRRGADALKKAQAEAKARPGAGAEFTLEALARKLGTRKPTLSDVLNGLQSTFDQLPKLCELLDVPIYSVIQGLSEDDEEILAAFAQLKEAGLARAELEGLHLKVEGLKSRRRASPTKGGRD